MNWTATDTWIVVIGGLCAAACALPGCFLVLRRMSMMGDAISHAVLPGLAVAFLITSSRASFAMFLGAAVVGILTAVFTQWVTNFGKVDRGAAMGIVFTTLFAIGLVLIVQAADHVDLDPGCVLYGALEGAAPWPGEFPRVPAILGTVLLLNIGVILLLYKELKLSSFDPDLATSLGYNANLMHYVLMTMVAITTVAAFESVGSIIVIAMLIVPASTAYLLTHRLHLMLILSVAFAFGAAFLGHLFAATIPVALGMEATTTSGMMAGAAGLLFLATWLFSPTEGLVTRRFRSLAEAPTSEPEAPTA